MKKKKKTQTERSASDDADERSDYQCKWAVNVADVADVEILHI